MNDKSINTADHLPMSFKTLGLDYKDEKSSNTKRECIDGFEDKIFEVNVNNHVPGESGLGVSEHEPYGTHITKAAANKMVKQFWDKITFDIIDKNSNEDASLNISTEIITDVQKLALEHALRAAPGYVIFSKESIAFLLSQKNCVGIKFYFCINHLCERSLVLVGVDKNDCDLGADIYKGSVIDIDFPNSKEQGEKEFNEIIEEPNVNSNATLVTSTTADINASENSALVEVGGPNRIVTLMDAINNPTDSYSNTIREYFSKIL